MSDADIPPQTQDSVCDKLTQILGDIKKVADSVANLLSKAPASLNLDSAGLARDVADAQVKIQSAIPGFKAAGICPK